MRSQPCVILGGFLIQPSSYDAMGSLLEELSGQPVQLIPVSTLEWLLTLVPWGWARILDRVAVTVGRLAASSPTGKVTLIGHSSGGVMLRLFLSDQAFQGRHYNGKALADQLVMLGSPHTNIKGAYMRRWVDRQLPGASYAPEVHYLSVAGDLDLAKASPSSQRFAALSYRNINGDGDSQGDGLVPVGSALLSGSTSLVLKDVAHGSAFGPQWYGSPEVVRQWWTALSSPSPEPGRQSTSPGGC
ncbi:MAG: esterase/lipase family protein [Synechococcus lacustris]|jgi:hypothetical protein